MEQSKKLANIDFIEHGFYNAADSTSVDNPILMKQVHSADVSVIEAMPSVPPQVDALVTKTAGLNLTVKTADCAPILIVDTEVRIIAGIHAGWKGAFQGIIENTILKMIELGGNPAHMVAGVGPHLQQKSFEVDTPMRALFPVTESNFFKQTDETHYLFDFDAYIVHRLKRAGITQIDTILIDTFANKEYNSYRRDAMNPNRQYSSIRIKNKM